MVEARPRLCVISPPMALSSGARLGPYEVVGLLGEGGMGAVYRARDTKLNRDVAIKVLPDAFAHDAERLARFQREAQTLAALNHPNIAHIHGLEEAQGIRALVMELVDGDDLSVRIARGPIPIDEVLPIARQIADALEAAHEQGIIHRDLKPANIKVRPDGTVKVLDFGLAKAMGPATAAGPGGPALHTLVQSPTITNPAGMTAAGIILGTAGYMSPEQARGKLVDRRTDIWAFGVVLFAMLTGQRAFEGELVSDVLASVLKTDPRWHAVPPGTPVALGRLLRRCLEKDPRRRVQAIGEARIAIEDAMAGAPEETVAGVVLPAAALWRRALPWSLAAALPALLRALWAPWRPAPLPEQLRRLSIELGADASLVTGLDSPGSAAMLSPDGSVLAFVARKGAGNATQLYARRLDQVQATPLEGTEGARHPFFSPDGQWIAFFAGGKLKKVAATGGAVITLCDAPNDRGGTWSEEGSILFAPGGQTGLWRVSSAGGAAEALTTPDRAAGETTHHWPQALPGGEAVLFTARRGGPNVEAANRGRTRSTCARSRARAGNGGSRPAGDEFRSGLETAGISFTGPENRFGSPRTPSRETTFGPNPPIDT